MLRLVLLALLMLSGLGLILHNFQDFSFYGPVYTLIKHGHLGCALLWRGFFEPGRQRGMPPSSTSYLRISAIMALSKLPSSS